MIENCETCNHYIFITEEEHPYRYGDGGICVKDSNNVEMAVWCAEHSKDQGANPSTYDAKWTNKFDKCDDYEPDESKNTGCFLVTACMKYINKPRDCEELNKARGFRDNYIKNQPNGELIIKEYYEKAPLIVKKIEETKDSEAYKFIFESLIKCDELIDTNKNNEAMDLYFSTFHTLLKKYNIK